MVVVKGDPAGRRRRRLIENHQGPAPKDGLSLVRGAAQVSDHGVHLRSEMLHRLDAGGPAVTVVIHDDMPAALRGQFNHTGGKCRIVRVGEVGNGQPHRRARALDESLGKPAGGVPQLTGRLLDALTRFLPNTRHRVHGAGNGLPRDAGGGRHVKDGGALGRSGRFARTEAGESIAGRSGHSW